MFRVVHRVLPLLSWVHREEGGKEGGVSCLLTAFGVVCTLQIEGLKSDRRKLQRSIACLKTLLFFMFTLVLVCSGISLLYGEQIITSLHLLSEAELPTTYWGMGGAFGLALVLWGTLPELWWAETLILRALWVYSVAIKVCSASR